MTNPNSLNRDWEKRIGAKNFGHSYFLTIDGEEIDGEFVGDFEKNVIEFIRTLLEEAKAEERKKIIGLLREDLLMAKQDGKFYEKEYGGSKTDPRIRVNYLLHRLDDIDQAISAITNKDLDELQRTELEMLVEDGMIEEEALKEVIGE